MAEIYDDSTKVARVLGVAGSGGVGPLIYAKSNPL